MDTQPPPRRLGHGLTEYVLRTGKPTLTDPVDFEHLVELGEVETIGSPSIDWLGVPLTVQNQVIGVLAVQTYTEGIRFSETERDLLVFVSNQIAMAIDRKRAEETLRMNEARFRAIVEDQTELICRFLPGGALTFVNEAFCRYYGKHREDLLGQPFIELIPEEYRKGVMHGFETLSRENPLLTTEHPGIKAGNFSTWEQWSLRAIFDSSGHLAEYQCVGRDMTERKKVEDELRYLSTHDSLTGIYNRAYFEEEIYRFQHGRIMPVSVVMADVDGLKEINDQFGHPTGDELLRHAANVLKNAFRQEDVVARIGGDEFGVLIPAADLDTAQKSVDRIRKSLEAHNASPGEYPRASLAGVCYRHERRRAARSLPPGRFDDVPGKIPDARQARPGHIARNEIGLFVKLRRSFFCGRLTRIVILNLMLSRKPGRMAARKAPSFKRPGFLIDENENETPIHF